MAFAGNGKATPELIRAAINRNTQASEVVRKAVTETRCPQQPDPELCLASYEFVLSRYRTEKSELELILAAMLAKAPERDQIFKIIDVDKYNLFDQETVGIANQLDLIYPVSKQTTQPLK